VAKSVAFTFGRFNPPTIGHEKLMDMTRGANKNYRVYASQSQDAKKNPLPFKNKVSVMKKMFPVHARKIKTDKIITPFDILTKLYKEKYTDVLMVVGSDRVAEFEKKLTPYNGKKAAHGYFKFNSIRIISAGERDPDADGATGMSASKMRKAVKDNDYAAFSKGLPRKFRAGKSLFKMLQKEMGVKAFTEWTEGTEIVFHKDPRKKKDKGTKPSDQLIPQDKAPRIEGFRDRVFRREYEAAARMYQTFRKRGDKHGVALHRASSSYKHVTDRGLQDFISTK
jgi:nicotinic acid mononucleotide adenylyltransferase